MTRLRPNTLSSQMVAILFAGVTVALASSAAIHLQDRNQALSTFGGVQTAQRFATIVQLLDPLPHGERLKISSIVKTPLQYLRLLDDGEPPIPDEQINNPHENHVRALLVRHLGDRWPLRVLVMGIDEPNASEKIIMPKGPYGMMGNMMGNMMGVRHQHHMKTMNQIFPQGISFLAQVQLSDGTWAEFRNHLPRTVFTWPIHLLLSIVILFIVVTSLSLLAVRLATRPLSILATAAQALGQDIHRPPLKLTGSREVRHAARAFNTMQARLIRYIQERTQLLAAISHDLKTPMTRMRLRIERLQDVAVQSELLHSLSEMENMTFAALDYIRGMEGMEPVQQADIPSLLDKLQEEFEELDKKTTIQCAELPPFPVMQKSLKRCLTNLLANAVTYGKQAHIRADILGNRLRISIADEGPGIPEADMEKVFEPFVRLEDSRNRDTGGTGLGLSIARNIARAHGGELKLRNRPEGGLEAILTLPVQATEQETTGPI